MKHTFLILIILTSLVLTSCHKEETEEEAFKRELPGDYDWESSLSDQTNGESGQALVTYTPDINGNNYGLKIKKNGKVFIYENGKLIKKGEIKTITQQSYGQYPYPLNYYFIVVLQFGNETLEFSSRYGFTNKTWPYSNCRNYFSNI